MPSAISDKVTASNSEREMSIKTENSLLNFSIKFLYSLSTSIVPVPCPIASAIISSKGIKLLKGMEAAGLNPFGLSANYSTLFRTPIVKDLPQFGQILLYFFDSAGDKLIPQRR